LYAVAIATIYLLKKISPGGPCAAGLGDVAFFLLLPISAALFCVTFIAGLKQVNKI
jgi:hypothetical protein